jgi:predicted acylesterase/phospholipase RssA
MKRWPESDMHPDWNAGISIGSINAAIIAGTERHCFYEECLMVTVWWSLI